MPLLNKGISCVAMKESLRLLFLGGDEATDVPVVGTDVDLARLKTAESDESSVYWVHLDVGRLPMGDSRVYLVASETRRLVGSCSLSSHSNEARGEGFEMLRRLKQFTSGGCS
ncbi:hypothetical protein IG631_17070 [Alternaria alternata]|nr:hypothetical protein IG631_17070 [Alternaria alternata]